MKRFRDLTLMLASVILIASCNDGDDSSSEVGGNNNGSGGSNTPTEQPVEVEVLPDGVVIGSQTVQLNSVQLEHIIEVDDDNATLFFSSSLPDEQIPQKGQIILKFSPNEQLPYGFLGRVSSITQEGDRIIVNTEAPTISEAFDELKIDHVIELGPSQESRGFIDFEDGYAMIGLDPKFQISEQNFEASVDINLGLGGKLSLVADVDNGQNKNNVTLVLETKFRGSFDARVQSKSKEYNIIKKDIGNGIDIPTPAKTIGLKLTMKPRLVLKSKGDISIRYNADLERQNTYKIVRVGLDGKIEDVNDNTDNADNANNSLVIDQNLGIEINGEIFGGIEAGFELTFMGRKELKISVTPELGACVESTLTADFSKTKYEWFKDIQINRSIKASAGASIGVNVFKKEAEWGVTLASNTFAEQSNYLFPSFSDGTCIVNEARAYATINVERDLLWETDIAIGQYGVDGKLKKVSETASYKTENKFSNPMFSSFNHLEEDSYWSVIKWGDDYIKCVQLPVTDNDPEEDENEESSEESMIDEDLLIGLWRYVPYDDDDSEGYLEFYEGGTGRVSDIDSDYHFDFAWYIDGSTLVAHYYDEYEGYVTETAKILVLTDTELIVSGEGNIVSLVRVGY